MFFTFSKLFWMIVSPLNFIALILLLGITLYAFKYRVMARYTIGAGLIIFLVLAVLPIGPLLLHHLEQRYDRPALAQLPDDIDGIIVLGGFLKQHESHARDYLIFNSSASRFTEFLKLAQHYPDARHVISGGDGSLLQNNPSPDRLLKDYLGDIGFAPEKFTFENRSRNTFENFKYSHEKMQPGSEEKWILITSAFHMPRSLTIFCSNGWPVIPYPGAHYTPHDPSFIAFPPDVLSNYYHLDIALKEWIGIVAYRLFGKTKILLAPPSNGDTDYASPVTCS